jgi:hypothetical protein
MEQPSLRRSTSGPKTGPARPRPPFLRALGASEPPEQVEIDSQPYHLVRIFKHDSWAATALYANAWTRIVCKFHRRQPVAGIPMRWLGAFAARREAAMLRRLADVPNVPRLCGTVHADSKVVPNAVAREYIPGHPLGAGERVPDGFFAELRELLAEIHRRGLAYVDLHKRENILVGDDRRPYLIDFQIGFAVRDWWLARSMIGRPILRVLQQSDLYHLSKHVARCRPDLAGPLTERPWWIKLHRLVAQPFRTLRRRMLVGLGVRTGRGKVESEAFVEDGLRTEAAPWHEAA